MMNTVLAFWRRLKSPVGARKAKGLIDEELRFHVEQRTAENLAAGMSPSAAAQQARKRFGNAQCIREDCREIRGANFGEETLQDLRFGFRLLAKTPGFTAMAVLSLAIGIGLNSMVFSALNAAFLRPLLFKSPDTIVRVESPTISYPDYRELKEHSRSLAGLVAVSRHMSLLRDPEGLKTLPTEIVSPNYFSVLGVGAALGNVFSENDPRLANEQLVVISYRLWQGRFGGDPALAGKSIPLNNQKITVLGVAQKDYYGVNPMFKSDVWFPVGPAVMENRDDDEFELLGRRAHAISVAQVQAEMETIIRQIGLKDPQTHEPKRVLVWSEARAAMDHGEALVLLVMPIVGLVLLVACANVSSMLLARNEQRQREIAVRLALGAGRGRLTRQLLAESLLLAVLGAVFGLLLTIWAKGALFALIPPSFVALVPEPQLDRRVLALTFLLTLLATLVFGLAPAWRAARTDLAAVLKGEAALGARYWRRLRGRNLLVIGQLVVSVVFLATSGLLVRAFLRGNTIDLGFQRKAMLQLLIPGINGPESRALLERIRAIPGVSEVSLAMGVPLALSGGGATEKVFLSDAASKGPTDELKIGFNVVAPNYFQMMGIRLLRGRAFEEADNASGPRVVIISEAMAHRYWPKEDPIGKFVRVGNPQAEPAQVVGITRDVVRNAIAETAEPFIYLPLNQRGCGEINLLVATKGNDASVLVLVRRELTSVHAELEPMFVMTQDQVIRFALLPQWATAWLFGVLGLLAFGMAAAGLYGVISYAVARRTHELGVRMALGAQAGDTMRMILREGLVLALIGLALGLPAAFGVGSALRGLLYGINPADPAVLLGSSFLVILVVLAAAFFPARRAMKINPAEALRYE